MGNSRIQFQIDTMKEKFEVEKSQLTDAHANEITLREEAEQQLCRLKETLTETEENILSVYEELEDAKSKLHEAETEGKSKLYLELEDAEKRLEEARETVHRLEKSKNELVDYNQALEVEKIAIEV